LGIAALVLVLVVNASSDRGVDVRLGDDEFEVGSTRRLAETVAGSGPLLFADLLVGGDRDLRISHLGTDPDVGWYAFDARRPGTERRCNLEWQRVEQQFIDPCTGEVVPADGGDLQQYPLRVTEDGILVVDLTPEGEPGRGTTTTGA